MHIKQPFIFIMIDPEGLECEDTIFEIIYQKTQTSPSQTESVYKSVYYILHILVPKV